MIESLAFIGYCAGFLFTYAMVLRKSWKIKVKSSARYGTKKVVQPPTGDHYAAAFFAGVAWPFVWLTVLLREIGYWVKPKEIKRIEEEHEIQKLERELDE